MKWNARWIRAGVDVKTVAIGILCVFGRIRLLFDDRAMFESAQNDLPHARRGVVYNQSAAHRIISRRQDRDSNIYGRRTRPMVNDALLSLLVCPLGKAPLRREGDTLICTRCGPRFSIKDDIPNMLIEEAELPPGCSSLANLECVRAGEATLD